MNVAAARKLVVVSADDEARVGTRVFRTTQRCLETVDQLADAFARLDRQHIEGVWTWCRALSTYREAAKLAGRRATLEELGERIGVAQRGEAYSASWVSRVIGVGKRWTRAPRTPAEITLFWSGYHGNSSPVEERRRREPTLDELQERAVKHLRDTLAACLAVGVQPSWLRRAVAAELSCAREWTPDEIATWISVYCRDKSRGRSSSATTTTTTTATSATTTATGARPADAGRPRTTISGRKVRRRVGSVPSCNR